MQIFRARKQIRALRWDGRSLDEILAMFAIGELAVTWGPLVEGRSISFYAFSVVLKPGMWIVDDPDENLKVMVHEAFVQRYEPLGDVGAVMD